MPEQSAVPNLGEVDLSQLERSPTVANPGNKELPFRVTQISDELEALGLPTPDVRTKRRDTKARWTPESGADFDTYTSNLDTLLYRKNILENAMDRAEMQLDHSPYSYTQIQKLLDRRLDGTLTHPLKYEEERGLQDLQLLKDTNAQLDKTNKLIQTAASQIKIDLPKWQAELHQAMKKLSEMPNDMVRIQRTDFLGALVAKGRNLLAQAISLENKEGVEQQTPDTDITAKPAPRLAA